MLGASGQSLRTAQGSVRAASSTATRLRQVMRFENSMRNVAVAWLGQALSVLMSFVARGVFAHLLSSDYLGLESLFANVLTILSLAELGVGSAIVFSLYKPLAENDTAQVKALMRLFKRAYIIIGVSVAVVGCALTPFVDVIIKDVPDIPLIKLYFLMFVANTSVSYFFSYKGSLIAADQKKYIVSLVQYSFQILMCIAQVAVLLATHNYLLFLVCMVSSTLLQNIVISAVADRMYPFLRQRDVDPIEPQTLTSIKKNVFALIVHKVAGVAGNPANSIIISAFVGLTPLGAYGNYMLVINSLTRIMDQTFDAITAPVGNLGVTESKDYQYSVFRTCFFVNAFIYSVISIGLLCLFNPFIAFAFGERYVFPFYLEALIVLLFFLKGMRTAALTFTTAYGLFWFTKWKAVVETVVLLACSIVLVQVWGITGVVVSGLISTTFVSSIWEGFMLCKHGFERSSKRYFAMFYLYAAFALLLAAVAFGLCALVPFGGVPGFLVKGVIALVISVGGFVAAFHRTQAFAQTVDLAKRFAAKLFGKIGGLSRKANR